ncbi:lipopolysaccharide biosynthesis protein [Aeoliella mucimassa]|uniref:MurJ-like flippase n=1 Tax=Aeoliella mucimassa TaxID=2527972 RepID=A0A518ANZ0_9BACT|nr:lipopolysaccharide biosynthesis protein [Aeoliella mucimassa]QDU56446.1 MurJ-like flippase [Aeoliella mucimassa]
MATANRKTAGPMRPDTLLTSVVVLLVVNVVQRSIGFGRGLLFCRWLDPDALGLWDMSYGFLLLAAPVAVLGLPGSFGRYLERYRQRGQLNSFLLRTSLWTASLAGIAIAALLIGRKGFAYLVYGDSNEQWLIVLVTCTLAAVILHHFLEAVFAGLRVFRVVSAMQFVQSMLFAAISISLLLNWRNDAASVIVGYGVACLISAVLVLIWSQRCHWQTTPETMAETHRDFWPPLLRFAVWVWVTNLLSNLFAIIDRYMLVHYSGLPAEDALGLVGHYHTSMLLPMLLVSVANLLVGAITPHLSHHWEEGDQHGVSTRLNMILKLAGLGMFLAGIGVLLIAPWLFHMAFADKYNQGLHVLPWALASCVWFGLLLVAQTYVWCAEKTRRATIPLAIGLGTNVMLNLLLLPILGLQGAVMATALSTMTAFVSQMVVNCRLGMEGCRRTLVVAIVPLGLTQGLPLALSSGSLIGMLIFSTPLIFSHEERRLVVELLHSKLGRWLPNSKQSLNREGMEHA